MTKDRTHKEILLVALGGNALVRKGQVGTVEEQFNNLRPPVSQIAKLSRRYRIIITHGNGPQVGNLLLHRRKTGDQKTFGFQYVFCLLYPVF